jgi:hypothetical protein
LSVGWLEPDHQFCKGPVEPEDVRLIANVLNHAVQLPIRPCGRHYCGFCQKVGLPAKSTQAFAGLEIDLGMRHLFIPGKGSKVYVAPSSIIHYVLEHGYRPPEEFLVALRQCPPMGSPSYYLAMTVRGARVWSWFSAIWLNFLPRSPIQEGSKSDESRLSNRENADKTMESLALKQIEQAIENLSGKQVE